MSIFLLLFLLLNYVIFSRNNILLAHNLQNDELTSKPMILFNQNIPNLSDKQKLELLQQLFIQNDSLTNFKSTLNEEPNPDLEFAVCCSSLDSLREVNQKFYRNPGDYDKLNDMTEQLKNIIRSRIYPPQSSSLKVHNLNDDMDLKKLLNDCSMFIFKALAESIFSFEFDKLLSFSTQTQGIVAFIISNNYSKFK
ncbi:hypothetical protein [Candidatus Phytoplasma bonamiae]|uniref:Effector n=1 Tax=Candidatus Phytoplasma bonamiae TaxID=2982626 RepID=A0ABT9D8R3_9MOLU|nr:hypothetical protein ['Bonamia sp.' little leaf phytoplasma]MDO8064336.1 hypothetical protein ['Bonamia sp.' little leaf phytoplasma]MDV3174812.1 hypothetical protein ['Bonamia sp.' little leaf phytoplasma]